MLQNSVLIDTLDAELSHQEHVQLYPCTTSSQSSSHYIFLVRASFSIFLAPGSIHTLYHPFSLTDRVWPVSEIQV